MILRQRTEGPTLQRYLFDCETNGLLGFATKVHSLVLIDPDTGDLYSYADHPGYLPISEGIDRLNKADVIIGHNVIKFDVPVLEQIAGLKTSAHVIDTLVCSRLIWSDIGERDDKLIRRGILEPRYRGAHSLKAWGYRLKVLKGNYGGDADSWETWSRSMQDYCEQDVRVTWELFKLIQSKDYSPQAIELEHRFCTIISLMERNGFGFDVDGANKLYASLVQTRLEIAKELQAAFKPWWEGKGEITPRVSRRVKRPDLGTVRVQKVKGRARIAYWDNEPVTEDYTAGVPYTKVELVTFNPSSRAHIAKRLTALHGWKPEVMTTEGGTTPKVDETILNKLPWPEAKLLAKHFLVEKRIGQIAEGAAGWLRLERKGRIHGSVNTNGAVTGRCTHAAPNVAQTPSVGAPYGAECRALFGPTRKGWKQVGCDASGLELRMLAHFMARYDDGAYAKILLEGDIHTANQMAAGLPTRANAKTFIYAFLYGAGDEKIGDIVDPLADTDVKKRTGKRLKKKFLEQTPALKRLIEDVQAAVQKRGFLKGIDGRLLHIRSAHAALNTLLQSAGALVVKYATVLMWDNFHAAGFVWGRDWAFMAHVHDEVQIECKPEIADAIGKLAVESIRQAGEHFGMRCPLDGEYKVGNNWADCH